MLEESEACISVGNAAILMVDVRGRSYVINCSVQVREKDEMQLREKNHKRAEAIQWFIRVGLHIL